MTAMNTIAGIGTVVSLDELTKPFPANAIKQRQVQGRTFDYVEGHVVIHRLNAATGNSWSMEIKAIDTITIDQNWKQVTAQVALTIPGLGTREHIGIQDVHVKGPDLVKGAVTDALKKAATLFGVGLELYGPDYEAGEVTHHPVPAVNNGRANPSPPTKSLQQQQSSPPQQRPQASSTATISEAQVKYLWSLSEQKGWSAEDVHGYIQGNYQKGSVIELTRREASEMLDMLKEQPDAKPAGPRQEPQKGNPQGMPAFEEPEWLTSAPPPDPDRWTT